MISINISGINQVEKLGGRGGGGRGWITPKEFQIGNRINPTTGAIITYVPGPTRRNPANPARSGRKQR